MPPCTPCLLQVYNYNLLNETRWRNDALKTIRNYRQGMVMTGPST